jgi:hypothetical protein
MATKKTTTTMDRWLIALGRACAFYVPYLPCPDWMNRDQGVWR